MIDNNRVYIFDTTLRDGEQSPGVNLNMEEKLQIARQLVRLGVDVIEAGFPYASPGDFRAVKAIAEGVKGVSVAALARADFKDIDTAWDAIRSAEQPRIHTFLATSDIHLKHKLRMSREKVLEVAEAAVKRAKGYTWDVEFSAEDAARSDLDFLCRVVETAIKAGATVINIPDTVGYSVPGEFAQFIRDIRSRVSGIEKVILSVHCHDDLGLAVSNSLSAVMAGANQVEGAINGIGERAGNASLEEVIMALHTRKDYFGKETRINTKEIYKTSRLVSHLTGMVIQPNKAIVGKNAFAHESGIHQDGMLKERTTYEIMNPIMVGLNQGNLVLGKHSGRHAFRERLEEMGYSLDIEELNKAFERFKDLADRKKEITTQDLEVIVEEEIIQVEPVYTVEYIHISSGSTVTPMATVGLLKDGENLKEAAWGNGPVDAICQAVDRVTGISCTLVNWEIQAVTSVTDALGEVTLRITPDGKNFYVGRGVSTDILEASAKAYVNGVNKLIREKESESGVKGPKEV
ncbi:MAG: 2-isopropylmalate synthase [Peptococcaceae bacterium]|nr:2-isopropylmalate synthase [Peptococcaceae bacterium]